MNVYLIRHGESVGNKKGIYQGPGVRLSEEGKEQAKAVVKRLENLSVDVIYASPYLRAKQTAEIIAKELDLPIEYWKKIRERKRPSEIEGLKLDHPKASKINDLTVEKQVEADWKYSDDESFNDLVERAREVEEHLFEHHQNQNVLCVTHGGIMKMIVLHLTLQDTLTPEVFWQFYYHSWMANTGISHVEYTKKYGWALLTWNDVFHL